MKRRDMFGAGLALLAVPAVELQAASMGEDNLLNPRAPQNPTPTGTPLIFTQRDSVLSFNANGSGVRVGTVTGLLNGQITTNFQFAAVAPPAFSATDQALFTDLDGDQMLFTTTQSGRFLFSIAPDAPAGAVGGTGGPYTGVYTVTKASGKYATFVGRKFPCRGIAMNPAVQGLTGTVLVEVYSDRF